MKTKQFVWRRSAKLLRLYIRQSSNGLGHGVALLDVGSNPAWRAREQDGSSNRGETEHQLKKYREVEFFGLLPPKPIYMGRYPVAGSGPDCKSGALQLGWFESNPAHQRRLKLLTKGNLVIFPFYQLKNYPPGDGI